MSNHPDMISNEETAILAFIDTMDKQKYLWEIRKLSDGYRLSGLIDGVVITVTSNTIRGAITEFSKECVKQGMKGAASA